MVAKVLVLLLAAVCSLSFKASAVNFDGVLKESDWYSNDVCVVVSSDDKSNCDVTYATLVSFADFDNDILYLGFKANIGSKSAEISSCGVAVSVNGGVFTYVTEQGITDFDVDLYSVSGGVAHYSINAFSAEVAIGFKYGLQTLEKLAIRYVDENGAPSNIYYIDVPEYITKYFEAQNTTEPANTTAKEPVTTATEPSTTAVPKTETPQTQATTDEPLTAKATVTERQASSQAPPKPTKAAKTAKTKAARTAVTQIISYVYLTEKAAEVVDETEDEMESEADETSINFKQVKLYRGIGYATIGTMIILALGLCVAVNSTNKPKE